MINKATILAFSLLLALALSAGAAEQSVVIDIEGMTCNLCAFAIEKSLSKVKGVEEAKASYKEKKAWIKVRGDVSDQAIGEAVKRAGSYRVKGISRSPVAR